MKKELNAIVNKVFAEASTLQCKGIAEDLESQSHDQIFSLISKLYDKLWAKDFEGKHGAWWRLSNDFETYHSPTLSASTVAWIESLQLIQCKILARELAEIYNEVTP